MNAEIQQLNKQVRYLRYYALYSSMAIMIFFLTGFKKQSPSAALIHTKGIINEDSAGSDRTLIGATIPLSKYRMRTDTLLVQKHWAGNYKNSDQFMQWYSKYDYEAIGMVVLNEKGFDRVAMCDKLPDPNMGKRMFEATGLIYNDREGWESGGLGVNTTKTGKSRAAFVLDDDNGEAVHLIALEDGTKGLVIGGESGRLMYGM